MEQKPIIFKGEELCVPSGSREITQKMIEEIEAREGPPTPWKLSDFEVGKPLGRGRFGRVYVAREVKTHLIVVLKVLIKKEIEDGQIKQQLQREIEIQSNLSHPHIVKLYGHFHDCSKIYLILEYAPLGELFKYIRRLPERKLPEWKVGKVIFQVADALEYCHKKGVIHRDVKPENIVLDLNENAKLADFGWSVRTPGKKRRETICGTLDYLAPEIVDHKPYTMTVDCWCLGVLCYELLVGDPPFQTEDEEGTYDRILKLKYEFPSYVPTSAQNLIQSLLQKDPSSRLTLPEVKKHPWILSCMSEAGEKWMSYA